MLRTQHVSFIEVQDITHSREKLCVVLKKNQYGKCFKEWLLSLAEPSGEFECASFALHFGYWQSVLELGGWPSLCSHTLPQGCRKGEKYDDNLNLYNLLLLYVTWGGWMLKILPSDLSLKFRYAFQSWVLKRIILQSLLLIFMMDPFQTDLDLEFFPREISIDLQFPGGIF